MGTMYEEDDNLSVKKYGASEYMTVIWQLLIEQGMLVVLGPIGSWLPPITSTHCDRSEVAGNKRRPAQTFKAL